MSRFRIEPFDKAKHDRATFRCRSDELNAYFRTQASQDIKRRMGACFVAVEVATGRVAGFYTLSPAEVSISALSPEWAAKLPKYPRFGAARIGRLAVAVELEGQRLGPAMLVDALQRVLANPIPVFAVLVDAKDDRAVRFYVRNGFRQFADQPGSLYIVMAEVAKTLARKA